MPDQDKDLVQLFVRDLDRIELPPRGRWRPERRKESPLMRTGRYLLYASAIAAVLVLALIAGLGLRERDQAAAPPSPTPTPSGGAAAVATASPATASPAPTPTASPAGGRYVSALLGYSLELPPPWHRSICNDVVTQQTPTPMGEIFFGVNPRDFTASDLGSRHPQVAVLAEANPENLTPRQWVASGRPGTRSGGSVEDVTYAGRPAVRQSASGGIPTYVVQDRGRMYVVGAENPFGPYDASTQQTVVRIIESFRFITDAEQAAARAALPTAPPPRTPEQVADGVAAAFAAKNAAALAEFAAPCMGTFGEQAGGTTVSREKYIDDLRGAFAAGLAVTVRPRPFEGDRTSAHPNLTIGSTWQDARGTVERKLSLRRGMNDRWEWHGTIERFR
jgi:hypothetical protein